MYIFITEEIYSEISTRGWARVGAGSNGLERRGLLELICTEEKWTILAEESLDERIGFLWVDGSLIRVENLNSDKKNTKTNE